MSEDVKKSENKGFLRSFPKSFWLVNLMELFERGAYYGIMSILGVYLAKDGLGFDYGQVGLLMGIVYAITYIVPIVGGALADRYGYKKMLTIAFVLISAGYMATAFVSNYWAVMFSLGIMALGSGLFKPIISGTIARTTNESNSGFGFGLYYWMINLGALIAPLVVRELRNIDPKYAFMFSAALAALMLIPTIFFYVDPPKPKNTKKIKEVLGTALTVLSDSRFMLMVLLYSTFWILYFQNFGTVLWYLRDFIDTTPVYRLTGISMTVEFVTIINAGTIVLLQVFVSWFTKNQKPLPTMMLGMFIGSLGFIFLAMSQNVWIFILGIAVFSIGEMTAHPKYVSYIGLIAPKEKKAIYMGYAFLYGVIGSLIGTNVGGAMYESYLKPIAIKSNIIQTGSDIIAKPFVHVNNPVLMKFWLSFAILGIFSVGGLYIFHKIFGENTEKTRSLAKKVMIVIYSVLILIGLFFFIKEVPSAEAAKRPKLIIQASIMLCLGGLGLMTMLSSKEEPASEEE
jgi:proton-dependent oligopeptide transporter, POT family